MRLILIPSKATKPHGSARGSARVDHGFASLKRWVTDKLSSSVGKIRIEVGPKRSCSGISRQTWRQSAREESDAGAAQGIRPPRRPGQMGESEEEKPVEQSIGQAERFRCDKHVASCLGLVPGEESSGDRQRLGHISKQGNTLLRFLEVGRSS
jgi:transposase IS116/IS110/IS902 family protein